jgi:quercetin dioxygenase-like cupin family protein
MTARQIPCVANEGINGVLDVLGPILQFLNSPEETDAVYCTIIGTISPGVSVPLHSHPDVESFFTLSGTVQVLLQKEDGLEWFDLKPGDFVHIPADAKHAFRNTSSEPAVQLVTTTARHGRFFREIGRPVAPGEIRRPPTPDELQHFVRVAAAHQYWLGSPEENAGFGISLFQGVLAEKVQEPVGPHSVMPSRSSLRSPDPSVRVVSISRKQVHDDSIPGG